MDEKLNKELKEISKIHQLETLNDSIEKEYQAVQPARRELKFRTSIISGNLQEKVRLLLPKNVREMGFKNHFQKIRKILIAQMNTSKDPWSCWLNQLVGRWEDVEGMDAADSNNLVEVSISRDQPEEQAEKQITLKDPWSCWLDQLVEVSISRDQPEEQAEKQITLKCVSDKASITLEIHGSAASTFVLFKVAPEDEWGPGIILTEPKTAAIEDELLAANAFFNLFDESFHQTGLEL